MHLSTTAAETGGEVAALERLLWGARPCSTATSACSFVNKYMQPALHELVCPMVRIQRQINTAGQGVRYVLP